MPALAPNGRDLSLQSLPNGQIDMAWDDDGNPVFDDSEVYRVTTLLTSRLGEWFADPSGKRGSRLHAVKRDRRSLTTSELESYALQALVPAIEERRIVDVTAKATRLGAGKFYLKVSWRSRNGRRTERAFVLET